MLSRHRIISTAAAATLATGLAVGMAPGAFAADNCAAYGSQCPTVAATTVHPPSTPTVKGTTLSKPAALPFTGGEFALMATAGVVALGGGTALVVASRRRRTAA